MLYSEEEIIAATGGAEYRENMPVDFMAKERADLADKTREEGPRGDISMLSTDMRAVDTSSA